MALYYRRPDSKLYKFAQRQLITKDANSESWFSKISTILYKYGLASAFDLLTIKPDKLPWKRIVKTAIYTFWEMKLNQSLMTKSTLAYFKGSDCMIGKPHILWSSTALHSRDIRRATIKAKLLSGTYILQTNNAKWDKSGRTTSTCPMCGHGDEDIVHFLLTCSKLEVIRNPLLQEIYQFLKSHDTNTDFLNNQKHLVQMILDPTNCFILNLIKPACDDTKFLDNLERLNRSLCFALHFRRAQILNYKP